MKILVLTPRYPFPPIGGDKLRIYHIARFLAGRGHELTLLSLVGSEEREEADQNIFSRVITCGHRVGKRYLNSMAGVLGSVPLQVVYFYSRKYQRLVDAELGRVGYDAVLCHFVRAAQFMRNRSDVRRVCEMTDAFSKYYEDVVRLRRPGLRNLAYRTVEFRRMRRYEREIVRDFDRCVVVSQTDRDYVAHGEAALTEKLDVIPNGVDCERLTFYDGQYDDRLIVFIGNMRTLRNADACVYFAQEILPRVRRQVPDVRFKIIGADPRREVRRLQGQQGITVTGRVDDIPSAAHGAAVSVCPLRLAVGVQNKVLECMAMGIPVVTSPMGIQGLDVEPGKDVLVGRAAGAFARHVVSVLRCRELRGRIAASARKRVERDYSWEGRLDGYDRIFRECT